MRRAVAAMVTLALLAIGAGLAPASSAQEPDLVDVASDVVYDLRTDDGPVGVAWDISVRNGDPSTSEDASDGTLVFYTNLSIPVLRGADNIEAVDADGVSLDVTVDETSTAPVLSARIDFADRLFYEQTYEFSVRYEMPETRADSVLVTPAYVFLPIVASGDEATVRILAPASGGWEATIEGEDCERDGDVFRCSGSDNAYIAATAEISRPDAVQSVSFQSELQARMLTIDLSYFEGEDETAAHLQELIPAALPLIEDVFAFQYEGPEQIEIRQGGRQAVLGYEGITQCSSGRCEITISPVADDITVIHELTHLWTGIFAERWLSEGFAQLYADEVASRLPAELVRSRAEQPQAEAVDLPLDEWGEVTSVIDASAELVAVESAGYNLSLRFLEILRSEVGSSTLRDVNVAIADGGRPADSRRYMDVLEDASGGNLDQLFATWVFDSSEAETLRLRREARDRLAELEARAQTEGLPEGATTGVREDILDWNFKDALAKLDSIDADLATYDQLSAQLSSITGEAESMGLTMPTGIAEALGRWEFGNVRLALADARDALDAYRSAQADIDAPRNLWERFGLLGNDASGKLDDAAAHFAEGQFQASIDSSRAAIAIIDDASTVALRRVLIVTGIFAAFGLIILAAVWASHLREREFVDQ